MLVESPKLGSHDDVRTYLRRLMHDARPVDRRASRARSAAPTPAAVADGLSRLSNRRMLFDFWGTSLRTSGAWDSFFVGAFVSKSDLGFDVSGADSTLRAGLSARDDEDVAACERLGRQLLDELAAAPRIEQHTAHAFRWRPMFSAHTALPRRLGADWEDRVVSGLTGHIVGSVFGEPFLGCSGDAVASVYGSPNRYLETPDMILPTAGYELLAVDALDAAGRDTKATDFGVAWRERVRYAWFEWLALHNLCNDLPAPRSGWHANPTQDWASGFARSPMLGLAAPGWPEEAARLAQAESSVTHAGNGVDAAVFGAVLTSLSFVCVDTRSVVRNAVAVFADSTSEFASVVKSCLEVCLKTTDVDVARIELLARFADRYWAHTFPNAAAAIVALWFGDGDFTRTMAIIAKCGLYAPASGGVVGVVLGVLNGGVPSYWVNPLQGRVDTLLPDTGVVSIESIAHQAVQVAGALRFSGL